MKKQFKIDISKDVMTSIQKREVKMRSRWVFGAQKIAWSVLLVGLVVFTIFSIASFVFSLNTELYKDYLEFGKTGIIDLLKSIPWLAIVFTSALLFIGYDVLKRVSSKQPLRMSYAISLVILLAVVGGYVGIKSQSGSITSKLANNYRFGVEPKRIAGVIEQEKDGEWVIKTNNGVVLVKISGETLFKGEKPKVGDSVLVLISEKNGTNYARAIKLIDKLLIVQKATETPVSEPPVQVAKENPQPTENPQKTTTTTQKTNPVIEPNLKPTPIQRSIVLVSGYPKDVSSTYYKPVKSIYEIKWSANFGTVTGWKIAYNLTGEPVYPGDNYVYIENPGSTSGLITVKKSVWGPGLFKVRICAYNNGDCEPYSSEFTIDFQ